MFILEPLLNKVLKLDRERAELQKEINTYIEEAEAKFNTLSEEEQDDERDYMYSIRSYKN